jgi:hypothetical protein
VVFPFRSGAGSTDELPLPTGASETSFEITTGDGSSLVALFCTLHGLFKSRASK